MTDPTEQQLRELFAADAAGAPEPGGLAALARHTAGRRRHRRARATTVAGLVAAAVVGGVVVGLPGPERPDHSSSAVADCSFAVRFEGTQFIGEVLLPLPEGPVEPLGEAVVEPCNDTGPHPSGVEPQVEPRRTEVTAYEPYDPRQVLAVLEPGEGLQVLVAGDLPRDQRMQIVARLQDAAGVE